MELSRREKEILAQIEDEFTPKETAIAQALTAGPARRLQHSPTVRTWLGLLGLLALGLTMIPLGILLLDPGPASASSPSASPHPGPSSPRPASPTAQPASRCLDS